MAVQEDVHHLVRQHRGYVPRAVLVVRAERDEVLRARPQLDFAEVSAERAERDDHPRVADAEVPGHRRRGVLGLDEPVVARRGGSSSGPNAFTDSRV
ncbi:hypothetical protein [Amycolatopsis sp. MEPSY49]|uniref:hypothetical protein n=1 Tax=Amycolatopsis sp. MEPSY49 TaxID=3151600 RepID=UPI003EF73A8D